MGFEKSNKYIKIKHINKNGEKKKIEIFLGNSCEFEIKRLYLDVVN